MELAVLGLIVGLLLGLGIGYLLEAHRGVRIVGLATINPDAIGENGFIELHFDPAKLEPGAQDQYIKVLSK